MYSARSGNNDGMKVYKARARGESNENDAGDDKSPMSSPEAIGRKHEQIFGRESDEGNLGGAYSQRAGASLRPGTGTGRSKGSQGSRYLNVPGAGGGDGGTGSGNASPADRQWVMRKSGDLYAQ